MTSTQAELGNARPTRSWPADQSERWPIERLIPYANNARIHTEADLAKIAASIAKWGWTIPVLVDEDGVLIAGHARIGAAAMLGLTSIPVMVARGWSEGEKKAYRLADNQLAARAIWDPDLLRDELQELDFGGFDLGLIGFDPDQLKTIITGLGSNGLTDPDSVPEVPEQKERRDRHHCKHPRVRNCGGATGDEAHLSCPSKVRHGLSALNSHPAAIGMRISFFLLNALALRQSHISPNSSRPSIRQHGGRRPPRASLLRSIDI